jgi:hypothetical protein
VALVKQKLIYFINTSAAASTARDGYGQVQFLVMHPPPACNPLIASGTYGNCSNPVITVSLTDGDGDQIFGHVTVSPPPASSWSATFPTLPAGEYTFSAQIQCGPYSIIQSMEITLPAA